MDALDVAAGQPLPMRRTSLERAVLALEIFRAYWCTRRALAKAPISDVLESIRSRSGASKTASEETLAEARSLANAVVRLLRLLPGDTRCLTRSLVLARLMADRSLAAKLVIGTRLEPEFLAHAWVEHLQRPVLSPGDGSFARLVEL